MIRFLIFVLLITSCGKQEILDDQLGGTRSIQPVVVSDVDKSMWNNLCQALKDKDYIYRSNYLSSGSVFSFQIDSSDCGQDSPTRGTVQANLVNNGGVLAFHTISQTNNVRLKTSVETSQVGKIKDICQMIEGATQPQSPFYPAGNTGSTAIWFDIASGSSCPGNNTYCVSIDTGFKQSEGTYKQFVDEDFKVDMNDGMKKGNVLQHNQFNVSGCAEGERSGYTSILQSIN